MKKNRNLLLAGACCFTLLSVIVSRQSLALLGGKSISETQCNKKGWGEVGYSNDCYPSPSGSCINNGCPSGTTEVPICP